MADFDPPFSDEALLRRLPTVDERLLGFPCGPADQGLFNGLFHRIEAEIGEVISFAGLTPTDDRFTQLREAIEALIAAATGGGDTSQFLLTSQARARLPIFPEILNTAGTIVPTSSGPSDLVVPTGVTFQHRGIYPIQTGDYAVGLRTFVTVASKTYHLRWQPVAGFVLKDLADAGYNGGGAYTDGFSQLDSTYDDMLIARIITNGSNVLTITPLANFNKLMLGFELHLTPPSQEGYISTWQKVLNWARRPEFTFSITARGYNEFNTGPYDFDTAVTLTGRNRYNVGGGYKIDWGEGLYSLSGLAVA